MPEVPEEPSAPLVPEVPEEPVSPLSPVRANVIKTLLLSEKGLSEEELKEVTEKTNQVPLSVIS